MYVLLLGDGVNGSSTMCVATLDKKLNQLSYSNIGDCGLIVIRHIDSETAGVCVCVCMCMNVMNVSCCDFHFV